MKGSDIADRILSLSAIVSAIAAVAVSVYSARIDREHQRISVWPYVSQSNIMPELNGTYRRMVQNSGIGPALVGWFEVRVDGKPRRTWGEVVRAMTGEAPPAGQIYSSVNEGSVLLPGQPLDILTIPAGPVATAFFGETMRERLTTRICYCSLYRSCWISDSRAGAPRPVRECRLASERLFAQ